MNETTMHHLKVTPDKIGKYVLLPGDPGRVPKIAAFLKNPHHVQTAREYEIWNGELEGETVTVMSTGMGGPSTAIGVEELKKCGVHTMIRVGGCGGIDPELPVGTLIIPTGAIRKEGTGKEYVPVEFPAVPNYEVVTALKNASEKLHNPSALGVVECKDNFYGQHDPDSMPLRDELLSKWRAWKCAGAIGSEMESATLFIVASVRRMRAGTILMLAGNKERMLKYGIQESVTDYTPAIETAVEAMRELILNDKKIQQ